MTWAHSGGEGRTGAGSSTGPLEAWRAGALLEPAALHLAARLLAPVPGPSRASTAFGTAASSASTASTSGEPPLVFECRDVGPHLRELGRVEPALAPGRVRLATDPRRLGAAAADGDGAARLLQLVVAAAIAPVPRTEVWGVLNATPDSFSDGRPGAEVLHLVERGLALEAEGADVIDVGGESTRPGASPVPLEVECARVLPVVERLAARLVRATLSIDTVKAEVARRALELGCRVVNDTSGGSADRAMLSTVAAAGAGYVCMHSRGTPRTMQASPHYDDTLTEVGEELRERLVRCRAAGIAPERLWADPGLGFGKRLVDNTALLARLGELRSLGVRLLVGASRKSFVGTLTGVAEPAERLAGSLAAVALAVERGAHAVRVHDVAASVATVAFVRGVLCAPGEVGRP
jgi:dihydropteroate synthase